MGTAAITLDSCAAIAKSGTRRLARWWQQRMKSRTSRRRLEVEQSAMIGNKATVSLLSVDGERVLVGVTGGSIRFHALRAPASLELPMGGSVR